MSELDFGQRVDPYIEWPSSEHVREAAKVYAQPAPREPAPEVSAPSELPSGWKRSYPDEANGSVNYAVPVLPTDAAYEARLDAQLRERAQPVRKVPEPRSAAVAEGEVARDVSRIIRCCATLIRASYGEGLTEDQRDGWRTIGADAKDSCDALAARDREHAELRGLLVRAVDRAIDEAWLAAARKALAAEHTVRIREQTERAPELRAKVKALCVAIDRGSWAEVLAARAALGEK